MSTDAPATGTDDTTPTDPGSDTESTATEPTVEELMAEVEKWKGTSRKWEDRAKSNSTAAKELDRIRQESMTEQERAVEAARTEAEKTAAAKFAGRLVDAEVKAAAAGRNVDVDALLEGLDRGRFLSDDGEPDTEAITAWVDRIAPKPTEEQAPQRRADLGQGASRAMPLNGDPIERSLKSALGI